MTLIRPTTQPARWIVTNGAESLIGVTALGELTGVTPTATCVSGEGEQALLASVASAQTAQTYTAPTLPSAGTALKAGEVYKDGTDLFVVRQDHNRTEHDPRSVPALFVLYRPDALTTVAAWAAGEQVHVGTQRTYGGKAYKALVAHVTQSDWTPDRTPTLWSLVQADTATWAAGVAYKVGDVVLYKPNGKQYKCRQAHTSQADWTPPAVPALWLAL